MNNTVHDFIEYIEKTKDISNKNMLIGQCVEKYHLIQDRSVFYCNCFAVRFSYSKNGSFSNTVLSLSSLQKYDHIPFFTVLIKAHGDNSIFLANSTILSKISHSSQTLSMTNIRGSFNGSDIIKKYDGIDNTPANFDYLFSIHEGLSWHDNLQRLVDASSAIKSVSQKYTPNELQTKNILQSVDRADAFVKSTDFNTLKTDLNNRCQECRDLIAVAAHIENINIRGRLIEALITANSQERQRILSDMANIEQSLPDYDTRNGLGDYTRCFQNADTYTDIKTKIVYLNSQPKMYNIDKFLQCMAENKSVFLFFFIGINQNGVQSTALCSVYHPRLLQSMHLQFHWAGRSSRGVAQGSGDAISDILNNHDETSIDRDLAHRYLCNLLER